MGKMVPVIRAHGGYINKFLGDGIMFFHGAPAKNPRHAQDAVAAVLEMHLALKELNLDLARQDLPTLGMRAGITSGRVIVGDAGPDEACDYTALGHEVNLAARLEHANVAFASQTLLNDHAAQLLNGEFLLRCMGKLQVVGQKIPVTTYEPLALMSQATDEQHNLAKATAAIVDPYLAGDFHQCLAAIAQANQSTPPNPRLTKLIRVYQEECNRNLATPPIEFNGVIVLTEK